VVRPRSPWCQSVNKPRVCNSGRCQDEGLDALGGQGTGHAQARPRLPAAQPNTALARRWIAFRGTARTLKKAQNQATKEQSPRRR